MSPHRPNATPSIKAKTMATGARAISADRIENVQDRVSIVRLKKEKCRSVRVDRIDGLRARKIDPPPTSYGAASIGKIDNKEIDPIQSSGRYRRSRSDFCRAWLLLRMLLPRLSPARSRIHCSPSRGCFWKKRPVTMFN